jgi:hypothetical protein
MTPRKTLRLHVGSRAFDQDKIGYAGLKATTNE